MTFSIGKTVRAGITLLNPKQFHVVAENLVMGEVIIKGIKFIEEKKIYILEDGEKRNRIARKFKVNDEHLLVCVDHIAGI